MNEKREIDYFGNLGRGMERLFNEVLKEDGIALFRRHPRVVFGAESSALSNDLALSITSKTLMDGDKGTFTCLNGSDVYLIFRSPSPVKVSFLLSGVRLQAQQKLRLDNRLMSYFFDNKGIDPILPDNLKEFPALFERLNQQKAEIQIRNETMASADTNLFRFTFDYIALYHSGNPLRVEQKVKQRVIDYTNDERSVL
ncbi:MAG: hypothetical protein HY537_06270 [Deltaproteobacteria bacterium]|nr:hypothetical protein [Deltaproteobacteria bacterium]